MQSHHEWMSDNLLITMTGQPALAAPAGFDQSGLPVGLQIIGRNRDEVGCLRLARGYAQANAQALSRRPSITS
jgi:amidase